MAALALRAAAAGVAIEKLVAFEPPFVVDDSRKPIPATWVEDLEARGPADAVKYFMTKVIGLPGPFVAMMKLMPAWKHLKAMAPTLPYDARVVGDNVAGKPLDASQWAGIESPVLMVDGGKSPAWMKTVGPCGGRRRTGGGAPRGPGSDPHDQGDRDRPGADRVLHDR